MSSPASVSEKQAAHPFRKEPLVWVLVIIVVVPLAWAVVLGRPPGPKPAPSLQSLLKGISLISAGAAFMWSFLSRSDFVILRFVRHIASNYLYPSGRFTEFVVGLSLLGVGMLYFSAGIFR